MKIHELRPAEGAKQNSKRVGRGTGSGIGKTSAKGHKGQKARSGAKKNGFDWRAVSRSAASTITLRRNTPSSTFPT